MSRHARPQTRPEWGVHDFTYCMSISAAVAFYYVFTADDAPVPLDNLYAAQSWLGHAQLMGEAVALPYRRNELHALAERRLSDESDWSHVILKHIVYERYADAEKIIGWLITLELENV